MKLLCEVTNVDVGATSVKEPDGEVLLPTFDKAIIRQEMRPSEPVRHTILLASTREVDSRV